MDMCAQGQMHLMHVTTDRGIEVEPLLYACNHMKIHKNSVVCNVIKISLYNFIFITLKIYSRHSFFK